MKAGISIYIRNLKWRFQNPVTILLTLIQPLIWLVIFGSLFSNTSTQENYTAFILPGILVMSILSGAGISGIANYSTKENGSFYRIVISPVNRSSIIIGHILDATTLTFIQLTVLSLIAFLKSTRIESGILGLFLAVLLIFVVVFFVSSISYAISMKIPDENGFIAMVNTITLPLYFLSTALIEKENTTKLLKTIITFNPFSYVVNSLRNIILDTTIDLKNYLLSLSLFILLSIIAFIIANNSLKKELQK